MSSLAELRRHARGGHAQKSEVNLVLEAITEVIFDRRKAASASDATNISDPTPTEYYAALMTALDSSDQAHQYELLSLLAMLLPEVPTAVLRSTLPAFSKALTRICQQLAAEATAEPAPLRAALTCLGLALAEQPTTGAVWDKPDALKLFHATLSFITDARAKVRRAAQQAVVTVLSAHAKAGYGGLSMHVAAFVAKVLLACTARDCVLTMRLLVLLRDVLPLLPAPALEKLREPLLNLLSLGQPLLTVQTLSTIAAMMEREECGLTPAFVSSVVVALLEAQPPLAELEATASFCSTLPLAIARLHRQSTPVHETVLGAVQALCACFDSEHGKVHSDAAAALERVFKACVGEMQLQAAVDTAAQPSAGVLPPLLQRVFGAVEMLLQVRFHKAWPRALPVVGKLFERCGTRSAVLLRQLVVCLSQVCEAIDSSPASPPAVRKALDDALGAAIENMGPEAFLDAVPLLQPSDASLPTVGGVSKTREWLMPKLRAHIGRGPATTRLEHFKTYILGLARRCERVKASASTNAVVQKKQSMQCMQLWSLLPSFCLRPTDIQSTFRGLALVLKNAMEDQNYPELLTVCCVALRNLIQYTKTRLELDDADSNGLESDVEEDDGSTASACSQALAASLAPTEIEAATADYKTLQSLAKNFIPLLFKIYEQILVSVGQESDQAQQVLDTVAAYASIAQPGMLPSIFKQLVRKLLQASTKALDQGLNDSAAMDTEESESARKAMAAAKNRSRSLMGLVLALVPSLEHEELALLLRVIQPQLGDNTDTVLQKRSYAALYAMCKHHRTFVLDPTCERLAQLMQLLGGESLLSCPPSAKKLRLGCLVHVVAVLDVQVEKHVKLISDLVGELMLCTKEANRKARAAAFRLLDAVGDKMSLLQNADADGLVELFKMLLGGLAATTPHMRSASVMSLSRLVYRFSDEERVAPIFPQLLQTVLMLLHEKAREVVKSAIGFVKVMLAVLPTEILESYLPQVVEGLLVWAGETKNRFRAKIKLILQKLCRKFGFDKISAVVPASDQKLISHLKQTKAREERKRKANSKRRGFDEIVGSDEEDADIDVDMDDSTSAFDSGRGRRGRQNRDMTWVREKSTDGGVIDLLDSSAGRNLSAVDPKRLKRKRSASDDLKETAEGRLIIPDDDNDGEQDMDTVGDGSADDSSNGISKQGGRDWHTLKHKRAKAPKAARMNRASHSGDRYKSKKAKGDVQKQGQAYQPYAYLPLDPKMMSHKNRREAVDRFAIGKVGTGMQRNSKRTVTRGKKRGGR